MGLLKGRCLNIFCCLALQSDLWLIFTQVPSGQQVQEAFMCPLSFYLDTGKVPDGEHSHCSLLTIPWEPNHPKASRDGMKGQGNSLSKLASVCEAAWVHKRADVEHCLALEKF